MSNHLILNFRSLGSKPDAELLEFTAILVDVIQDSVVEVATYTEHLERQNTGSLDHDNVIWWLNHPSIYNNWRTSPKVSISEVADTFANFIHMFTTPATTIWGNVSQLELTVQHLLSHSGKIVSLDSSNFADFDTLIRIKKETQPLLVANGLESTRLRVSKLVSML